MFFPNWVTEGSFQFLATRHGFSKVAQEHFSNTTNDLCRVQSLTLLLRSTFSCTRSCTLLIYLYYFKCVFMSWSMLSVLFCYTIPIMLNFTQAMADDCHNLALFALPACFFYLCIYST